MIFIGFAIKTTLPSLLKVVFDCDEKLTTYFAKLASHK
jgi:hypothetical protein